MNNATTITTPITIYPTIVNRYNILVFVDFVPKKKKGEQKIEMGICYPQATMPATDNFAGADWKL